MTETQSWTVGKLLAWTTDFLRKHGSESPRLEAEVLLAHARRAPRIQLYTSFNEEPSETERATFREMVRRRADGTPVAYLVGHKEFYSLDFTVTPACLIPRPETEHLVVTALDWLKQRSKDSSRGAPFRVVDVGTGSGCVAISIAKHFPGCEITGIDLSGDALQIAARNVADHGLQERIELLEGSLLEPLLSRSDPIDLVVSNPPYVSAAEYAQLPRDVREHEPELALVSPPSGMEISQALVAQAEQCLPVGSALMIESSPMLLPTLREWSESRDQWSVLASVKDLQHQLRVLALERR